MSWHICKELHFLDTFPDTSMTRILKCFLCNKTSPTYGDAYSKSTSFVYPPGYVTNYVLSEVKFLVFMWRNHLPELNITLPSEVLVLSDKRPHRNLTFRNVLARQGSSYCNRARLNFQAFALRDMTMAARESGREGQKKSYRFSFC